MEDVDEEGAYSSGRRIFFRIGCKLLSQAKVDCAHAVEPWVRAPHGRKDLSHGVDVLFHASFVDELVVGLKDSRADFVSKDLWDVDCFPDASEINWDA